VSTIHLHYKVETFTPGKHRFYGTVEEALPFAREMAAKHERPWKITRKTSDQVVVWVPVPERD
jgi:hypothetical protein